MTVYNTTAGFMKGLICSSDIKLKRCIKTELYKCTLCVSCVMSSIFFFFNSASFCLLDNATTLSCLIYLRVQLDYTNSPQSNTTDLHLCPLTALSRLKSKPRNNTKLQLRGASVRLKINLFPNCSEPLPASEAKLSPLPATHKASSPFFSSSRLLIIHRLNSATTNPPEKQI